MKQTQKLILPALIVVAAILVYFLYFSPKKDLGLFSDFDPNNNANKDIRVIYVVEKGVRMDPQSGGSLFYARDRDGIEMLIQGPRDLPPGMSEAESIVLRGHLHHEYFHAAGVYAD